MTDDVRGAYDAAAAQYAELFLTALDDDGNARAWLAAFAELAANQEGPVADLGCGPGYVVDHLSTRGLSVVGYDLSPGQIAEARRAFPGSVFFVGDLAQLDLADCSLGGIVSRYSIIHLPPSALGEVFEEWCRVLEPGAPVLVTFFGSTSVAAHGTPFDHQVVTAYELSSSVVARQLGEVGFGGVEVGARPPPEDGRPYEQATILARKPIP